MRLWTLMQLAAAAPDELDGRRDQPLGEQLGQVLTVAAVIVALGALLFLVVYLLKRNKNESPASEPDNSSQRHHHHHRGLFSSRRHRKRRQERRPRNPSLAEAGGLPPLRPEEPPKPSA